jgi:hypothetical protein
VTKKSKSKVCALDERAPDMAYRKTPEADSPPLGWFVLDVMRKESRSRDWVALMTNAPRDELKSFWAARRPVRECWVRIAGKHRSRDAACAAFEDMRATRH